MPISFRMETTLPGCGGTTCAMNLKLLSIEKDGIIRVANEGPILAGDFDPLGKNPLENVLGVTWSTMKVLLDFSKTDYVDSSAVGWLIGTQKAFKQAGGVIVVHSIQPSVRQIFDLLKIGKVIPIVADESEARELAIGGGR
jgi:anti-anti-sigma factor